LTWKYIAKKMGSHAPFEKQNSNSSQDENQEVLD